VRAVHSEAAGSHRLLPSRDHGPWHPRGMASKKPEMYRKDGFEARSNGSVNCSQGINKLRWALVDMKELDSRENERRKVLGVRSKR
jgi:hypothetical protein